MKTTSELLSKILYGVSIACVVLSLVSFAYGDPPDDGGLGGAPGRPCTTCAKAWWLDNATQNLMCEDCPTWGPLGATGASCYENTGCTGGGTLTCNTLCSCTRIPGGNWACQ
jgi:hypothetical protein